MLLRGCLQSAVKISLQRQLHGVFARPSEDVNASPMALAAKLSDAVAMMDGHGDSADLTPALHRNSGC